MSVVWVCRFNVDKLKVKHVFSVRRVNLGLWLCAIYGCSNFDAGADHYKQSIMLAVCAKPTGEWDWRESSEGPVGLSAFIVIRWKGSSQHVANFSHRDWVSIIPRLSARCTNSLWRVWLLKAISDWLVIVNTEGFWERVEGPTGSK